MNEPQKDVAVLLNAVSTSAENAPLISDKLKLFGEILEELSGKS